VKPYYDESGVTIYHGDALEVLDELEISVDSVLTDPPYASGSRTEASKPASGAMMRGVKWNARPIDNDQMTTTGFVWLMRQTALRCYPLLPDGASFLSFIDWRQWPNLVGALETCNYRVQGMVVWDKESMGLGNGFRSQHELICHASKGVPTVHDRALGNVLRHKRDAPTDHPSPKPPGLLRDLLSVVTEPGALILDPFMGSGSTLVACRDAGRRVVGIESVEAYCDVAARRLSQTALDFGGAA
jgi:DNA modification methylase